MTFSAFIRRENFKSYLNNKMIYKFLCMYFPRIMKYYTVTVLWDVPLRCSRSSQNLVYVSFSCFDTESCSETLQIIKSFPSLPYSFDPWNTPQILNEIKAIRFLFRTRDWKEQYITIAVTQCVQRRAARAAYVPISLVYSLKD